jgi:hypothetical protein
VRLTDGREWTARVPCSVGSPERPLDEAGVLAKAAANVGGAGPELTELARRVAALADEPDLSAVLALADSLARPAPVTPDDQRTLEDR